MKNDINDKHVHLTLSKYSKSMLENDSSIFGITISKLIEKIVVTYSDSMNKISHYIKSSDNLGMLLYNIFNNSEEILFIKTISKLLITDKTSYGQRNRSFSQVEKYMWHCTQKAQTILESDTTAHNMSEGTFIAALIEEYSNMDFGAREKIMYRELVEKINNAIKEEKSLYIKSNNKEREIYPYKIITEPNTRYNYFVGAFKDDNDEICVTSYRLSSLKFHSMQLVKSSFSQTEDFFRNSIADRNIAYLVADEIEIGVDMTEKGELIFSKLVHNRPKLLKPVEIRDDGLRRYVFKCSPFQAKVFFSRIEECKIVYPENIAEELKQLFLKLYKQYD